MLRGVYVSLSKWRSLAPILPGPSLQKRRVTLNNHQYGTVSKQDLNSGSRSIRKYLSPWTTFWTVSIFFTRRSDIFVAWKTLIILKCRIHSTCSYFAFFCASREGHPPYERLNSGDFREYYRAFPCVYLSQCVPQGSSQPWITPSERCI